MEPHSADDELGALATVIPFTSARSEDAATSDRASLAEPMHTSPSLAPERAIDMLRRRIGDRWAEVPTDLGRVGLHLVDLVRSGPTAVDPEITDAVVALERVEHVVASASGMLELLGDEAPVLSEALAVDVADLPLERLHEVVEAVIELSRAPRAVPAWGHAANANSAHAVLQVAEGDLRRAATTHASLYERFTDGIWEVPPTLLVSGRRRWRLMARAKLRRQLRSVSRSGGVPGPLGPVAAEVLDAHSARARLSELGPLLAQHLGELDRGALTDVDSALAALSAVRRLQGALGDHLDGARIERLLLAGAFRSADVVGPAVAVRNILDAWASDVRVAHGERAWVLLAREVESWALAVALIHRDIERALDGLQEIDLIEPTLRSLVDVLVLREHAATATAVAAEPDRSAAAAIDLDPTGSAS